MMGIRGCFVAVLTNITNVNKPLTSSENIDYLGLLLVVLFLPFLIDLLLSLKVL